MISLKSPRVGLDQHFQMIATMAAVLLSGWLMGNDWILFQAMGPRSPLITHALPWAPIGISLAFGVVCLLCAAKSSPDAAVLTRWNNRNSRCVRIKE